jgi:hypothetical protein
MGECEVEKEAFRKRNEGASEMLVWQIRKNFQFLCQWQ